jgi:hypothetical protein
MKRFVVMLVVGMLAAAGTAFAQGGVGHPGYYPIEEMGILAQDDLEVDVDLQGAMLQVVAGAIQNDENDPDLAALVSNLERVRVQVGSPQRVDQSALEFSFQDAIANMESTGWYRILRVLEDEEQVYLYAREGDGRIVGLTVLVNDGAEEVVLVNIVGDIDPVALGKSLSKLDNLKNFEQYMNDGE